MKTHKFRITLALVVVAFGASAQASHLQKVWETEIAQSAPKDTTFNNLAQNLSDDAADVAKLNGAYQDLNATVKNIQAFNKKHKSEISGKSNGKIVEIRQTTEGNLNFVEGRLKEIREARIRIRHAIEKANTRLQNSRQTSIEQKQELSESFATDNDSFVAKKQKNDDRKAKADAQKAKDAKKFNKKPKKEKVEKVKTPKVKSTKSSKKTDGPVERGF